MDGSVSGVVRCLSMRNAHVPPGGQLRRKVGIEVIVLADGLMVRQAGPSRVHQLNNSASVILESKPSTSSNLDQHTDRRESALRAQSQPEGAISGDI